MINNSKNKGDTLEAQEWNEVASYVKNFINSINTSEDTLTALNGKVYKLTPYIEETVTYGDITISTFQYNKVGASSGISLAPTLVYTQRKTTTNSQGTSEEDIIPENAEVTFSISDEIACLEGVTVDTNGKVSYPENIDYIDRTLCRVVVTVSANGESNIKYYDVQQNKASLPNKYRVTQVEIDEEQVLSILSGESSILDSLSNVTFSDETSYIVDNNDPNNHNDEISLTVDETTNGYSIIAYLLINTNHRLYWYDDDASETFSIDHLSDFYDDYPNTSNYTKSDYLYDSKNYYLKAFVTNSNVESGPYIILIK